MIKTRKIAILGFGREGKSLLRFIKKDTAYKNAEVWALDRNRRAEVPKGAKAGLGKNYLKNLGRFEVIFRSPGIPYNLPELVRARKNGVVFSSATKLFFEHCPTQNLIGITGTKGKGTTSTLLYGILKAAHKRVFLAGNIGSPMLDLLHRLDPKSFVILELSSFQLQDLATSPPIAAVLDIFPDHQDAHLNLKEYYEAKTNIARHQKADDKIFFFKNHPLSRWVARKSRGRKIAVDEKTFDLFSPNGLKVPGHHNFENAMMAATVARTLGTPPKIIMKSVKSFRGMEHRLEFVRRMGETEFWNDSASTNPQTSAAALHAFPDKNKILVAGGQDKNLDYAPLKRALKETPAEAVILFGENQNKIKRQIANSASRIVLRKTLEESVKTAYKLAEDLLIVNNRLPAAILFSPGSASFDQFKNYADRGKQFKALVKKLR